MAAKKETTKKKDTATKKKATPKKKAEKKVIKPVEEESEFKAVLVEREELIPMDEAINKGKITGESVEYAEKIQKALSEDNAEEFFEAVDKFNELREREKLEVVNGNPAVLTPKEEEPKKVEKVVEKKETTPKKIIKRISKNFGYFWNGQMIDF